MDLPAGPHRHAHPYRPRRWTFSSQLRTCGCSTRSRTRVFPIRSGWSFNSTLRKTRVQECYTLKSTVRTDAEISNHDQRTQRRDQRKSSGDNTQPHAFEQRALPGAAIETALLAQGPGGWSGPIQRPRERPDRRALIANIGRQNCDAHTCMKWLDGRAGYPFIEFVVGSRSFARTGYSRPARTTCAQKARHDLFADRERRGGARARRVQDVHGVGLLDEVEILHQFALRGDGLGADAGAARIEIRCADLRDQALQRLGEQALAERAFDFLPTHASVTRQKVPQARIGNSVEEIARIDIPLAVTFAREGEHSVRTCFNTAVDQAGEVHAEEGELRIGHGVDQVEHERLAVRLDLVILAAERNDADFAAQTGQFAHTITMKAGAVDKELGFEVSRLGFGA